ncbi:hypothetical protein IAI18_15820 [Acetobacteraceae bacterium H6797]|nr:hypothetical protein [Acetobacteraceae bacterium H6797]
MTMPDSQAGLAAFALMKALTKSLVDQELVSVPQMMFLFSDAAEATESEGHDEATALLRDAWSKIDAEISADPHDEDDEIAAGYDVDTAN